MIAWRTGKANAELRRRRAAGQVLHAPGHGWLLVVIPVALVLGLIMTALMFY
jgi:hypothetical protein